MAPTLSTASKSNSSSASVSSTLSLSLSSSATIINTGGGESGSSIPRNHNHSRNRSRNQPRPSPIGILRLKLISWFQMYSCLFRPSRDKDKFEDQQVELIKGGIKNGNGIHTIKDSSKEESRGRDEPLKDLFSSPEFLNYGEEDQMEIEGYRKYLPWTCVTWTFIILTFGLLRLIFHWWPRLMLYSTHKKCSLKNADTILVMEHYQKKYKRYYVKPIYIISTDSFKNNTLGSNELSKSKAEGLHESSTLSTWDQRLEQELENIQSPKLVIPKANGSVQETDFVRGFSCKKLRYIWDEQYELFSKLPGLDEASTNLLHEHMGLSVFQQFQRRLIYGSNEIKVDVQSIVRLLFLEVLNPFYVFQIFSVTLWFSDNYVFFATAIVLMSMFGITSTIIQTRQNQKKLKTTVHSSDIVTVCRGDGIYEAIPTEHLVPGDVVLIPPHGCTMNCDAALLSGNCIVNESMLTGESVPVTKIPLPNRADVSYNSKEHARHTLFCGTTIMQTRYYGNERVLAVILRTGFLTAKGNLVRSIMYPPPVDYKFERDSYKFVAVLACIAGIGFINSIITKLSQGETIRNIVVDSLDLITIVVPPALPAAMTVGRMYAQRRLQKKGIYCISPRAINVSGSLDCVCFDKTGTLTEEGLDLWGTVPTRDTGGRSETLTVNSNAGVNPSSSATRTFQTPAHSVDHLSPGPFLVGMAACHSLTRIDGNLIGDPLDLKMFEWTDWILEEPGVADNEKFDMIAPTIVRPKPKEINDNDQSFGKTRNGAEIINSLSDESQDKNQNASVKRTRKTSGGIWDENTNTNGMRRESNKMEHEKKEEGGNLKEDKNRSNLELSRNRSSSWRRSESDENNENHTSGNIVENGNNGGNVSPSHSGTGFEVGIVRQFPFSSSLQRMSVITRTLGASEFEIFSKGSPEMISSLALPHTIPENFSATLERYTQKGYRVIALGHRRLPKMNYAKVQRTEREEVETDLTFLGLIIMENRLKSETTGVIRVLKNATIRTIMVTGDNMLTAVSVARECGMLEGTDKVIVLNVEHDHRDSKIPRLTYTLINNMNPMELEPMAGSPVMSVGSSGSASLEKELLASNGKHSSSGSGIESPMNRYQFAITGNVFSVIKNHYPELLPRILVRGTVFARMSPDQKQQLVELLQSLGYFVGMCGDGANDCGALKAAHAGISLSEAESSVASPFTSKEPNITCIPYLIREGRGALVTSFGIFKYMAIYSLTQFVTVIMLYTINCNLSDLQFLYIDLFLISVFALFFGHTEPYDGPLEKSPPSASLVSIAPIVSILCHLVTVLGIQVLSFVYVQKQPWFEPYIANAEEDYRSYENYSLFTISAFQYIIMAIVFSRGKPYRKSLVTNPGLLGSLCLMTATTIYLVLWPAKWFRDNLYILPPPDFSFRLILIGFALCNLVIALLIEHGIVNFILGTKLSHLTKRFSNKGPKSSMEYARIDYDLGHRADWPPLGLQSLPPKPTSISLSNGGPHTMAALVKFENEQESRSAGTGTGTGTLPDKSCGKQRHPSTTSSSSANNEKLETNRTNIQNNNERLAKHS